mgnify:CR=1 FL=1
MIENEVQTKLKQWNPNNFSPKSPLRNQIYYEHFIRNSHKYAELISFLKFYPDIYYDMIKPLGKGGLIFDDYQRMMLRILARHPEGYLCIPRRVW